MRATVLVCGRVFDGASEKLMGPAEQTLDSSATKALKALSLARE